MADIAAEIGYLLNHARAEIHILRGSGEEDGLSAGVELFIGESHLELILEVADGAESLYNGDSADIADVISEQSVKDVDNDVIEILCYSLYHEHTLGGGEAWLTLSGISGNKHDDLIEKL